MKAGVMTLVRVAVFTIASTSLVGTSWSQDARLDASSKAAYDASIVAMSEGHDSAFARNLILSLSALAAAEEPALAGPDAMRLFVQSPAEFYRRLRAHQGKTADEILAAADAL